MPVSRLLLDTVFSLADREEPSIDKWFAADVFTTWSGGVPIDRFIEISYVFSCFASLFFAKASLLMRSQSVSLPREAGFAKGVKIAVSLTIPPALPAPP